MINRRVFATTALVAAGLIWATGRTGLAGPVPEGFVMHDEPIPLPPISFQSERSVVTTLGDYAGKVVLLNLWATWCGPCRAEMPTLDRLQALLGGSEFEVLALSLDRGGADKVRAFYRELDLRNLSIYIDPAASAQRQLRVVGIPTTLLIDRDGRELGRLSGPAEWDSPEMIAFFKSVIAEPERKRDVRIEETRLRTGGNHRVLGRMPAVPD
ncbi:MAG: TlpA disulfide reductase family protein [Alphaproteobacteria bacterium]